MFTLLFGVVAASGTSGGIDLPLFEDHVTGIFGSSVRAWYLLNDTNTTALDETTNNSDGTYEGTYTQSVAGLVAQQPDNDCVDFGTGDVQLPTNTNLEEFAKSSGVDGNADGYCIMAVIVMDSTSASEQHITTKYQDSGTTFGNLYINTSEQLVFRSRIYQSLHYHVEDVGDTTLVTGRKYHVCGRMGWSGNSITAHKGIQVFLNGLLDDATIEWTSATSGTYPSTTYPWAIGATDTGALPFNGKIDNVIFYSGTPNDEDIYLAANKALHKFDYFTMIRKSSLFTTPISWWRFNETSGTIYDHMGLHDLTNLSTGGTYNSTSIPNSLDGSWTGAASNGFRKAVTSSYNYGSGAVEFWFKTTSENTEYLLQSSDESDINVRVVFHIDGTSKSCAYYISKSSGNTFKSAGRTYVCDGLWHHVVFQTDGVTMEIWLDGIQEETVETASGTGAAGDWFTDATPANRDGLTIGYGNNNGTNDEFFLGTLAHVAVYDTLLEPAEIKNRYRFGVGYHGLIENLGYVGHWKLDEPGNTSTASEYGGTYNGTYTNIASLHNDGATLQSAADFNESTPSYVNIADNASLELTSGSITLAAWIKYSGTGSKYILNKDTNSGHNGTYCLQTNGANKIRLTFYNGTANCYFDHTSTVDLTTGWHHIAITHVWTDDTSTRAYIDGIEQTGGAWTGGGGTGTPTGSTFPLRIGERSDTSTANSFNGMIQHVTVSNRYYSPFDIEKLYKMTGITLVPGSPLESSSLNFEQDFTSEASTSSNNLATVFPSYWGIATIWSSNDGFWFDGTASPKHVGNSGSTSKTVYYQKNKVYGSNLRATMTVKFLTAPSVELGPVIGITDPTGTGTPTGFAFTRYYDSGGPTYEWRIYELSTAGAGTERAVSSNKGSDIWTGNTFTMVMEVIDGIIYGYVDGVYQCKYNTSNGVEPVGYTGLYRSDSLSSSDYEIYDYKVEYI